MVKRVAISALVACVLVGGSRLAFGQATASINGRVVDQAGAVLPGASITVTNTQTNAARETTTNGEGQYNVPALPPGTYTVKAQLEGFGPQVRNDVQLLIGAAATVDVQLGVAQLQENLTVTGDAPMIETTQSVLASSIRQVEVEQLPMLNRNLAAMMTLLPGAREVAVGISAHGTSANYVSYGGGNGRNSVMLVDGIDNKEDNDGGTVLTYSLEGVQEFKVLTTGSAAEYGNATTTILLATKSGTNQFRGSAFGYFRNQNLVATDYFSKPENGGAGKPDFKREQYGGSVGGPVIKDRIWFFGSMERNVQDYSTPRSQYVYDQLQTLIRVFPDYNIVAGHSVPQPSRGLMSQGKINIRHGEKHNGWIRYSSEYGYVNNDFIGSTGAELAYSPFVNHNHQGMWNLAGGETWIINSETVNQFTAQYISYTHDQEYPACPASVPRVYLGVDLGVDACLPQRLLFPSVSIGQTYGGAQPLWTDLDNKLEIRDDLSKQIGRHAVKLGGRYIFMPVFGGIFGSPSPGYLYFSDDPSVIVNNSNGLYPQGFRTPGAIRLINIVSQTVGDYSSAEQSLHNGGPTNCQVNSTPQCALNDWGSPNFNFGAYIQDDFRLSPKLTINAGVRFDTYNYIGSQSHLETNRFLQLLKTIGNPYGSGIPNTSKEVSPRLGTAWDVTGDGKNVVRATWGLFYLQALQEAMYTRNFFQQDVLLTTNTVAGPPLANFVYGQTPLPAPPLAPTTLPPGGSTTGYTYDPNLKDPYTYQTHFGYSRSFPKQTVLAFDYTNMIGRRGWQALDINPLINGVRPLQDAMQRVYGDPYLIGPVNVMASVNKSRYDEFTTHFESRTSASAGFQVNYTLGWSRGNQGISDGNYPFGIYPQVASATGGLYDAPWEYGPTSFDERHRVNVAGVFKLKYDIDVSPSFTAASARPYTQYRAFNPSGDGQLMVLCPSGNSTDVGFGAGQVPCGINNARGQALVNVNARVSKNIELPASKKIAVFAEFYNIINRANFGDQYSNFQLAADYGKPTGYLGGLGATSTIPISFQVQFGARFTF
jgi:Carboxypeptidase regulatory-like domain